MKTPIVAALLLAVATVLAPGQVVTLVVPSADPPGGPDRYSTESVELAEGDVAEVLDMSSPDRSLVSVKIGEDEILRSMHTTGGTGGDLRHERSPVIVAGPATIRAKTGGSFGYVTVRVTRQGTDGIIPVPQSPSNTDYEVFLEASSDMETWVRVIPGDYSSNGAAKFFRVRMVPK